MAEVITENTIPVLDHGFVRLDDAMASDLSVVNGARVSFARHKAEMDESDEGLIRFLMRDRHGTPFEHNAFRFHVRAPLFVAREWFRHRVGCLTGDTVVSFLDSSGHASRGRAKTIDELWSMWTTGERNGHGLPREQACEIDRLIAAGMSQRSVARRLCIGRKAVRSHLAGGNEYRDARWRVRKMRIRVLNEDTLEFGGGHIADVIEKGVQPVYRLTLADGSELKLTENHRLLTDEGWRTMRTAVGLRGDGDHSEMTRECFVMANGIPVYQDRAWLKSRRDAGKSVAEIAEEAECSYHTVRKWLARNDLRFTYEDRKGRKPWNTGRRYKTGRRLTAEHKAAIRAARSGRRSNFWRGGISSARQSIGRWTREQAPRIHAFYNYTCQACGARGGKLHAHHVVPVWLDDSEARNPANLTSICEPCHRRIHRSAITEINFARKWVQPGTLPALSELPVRAGRKLTAHPVRVVSVQYVGLRPTYDLAIAGPWHNFVANGVVVHNSFNEFSMRYAKATDDFYVPAPEDVRSQVGKPGAYSFEPVAPELAEQTREELQAVYDAAYETYTRLVEQGVARELARLVIPMGAYTEFYWTVNARSLMNFVSLRAAETAQREIRRYAEACERFLAEKMPVTHSAFVENGRVAP